MQCALDVLPWARDREHPKWKIRSKSVMEKVARLVNPTDLNNLVKMLHNCTPLCGIKIHPEGVPVCYVRTDTGLEVWDAERNTSIHRNSNVFVCTSVYKTSTLNSTNTSVNFWYVICLSSVNYAIIFVKDGQWRVSIFRTDVSLNTNSCTSLDRSRKYYCCSLYQ